MDEDLRTLERNCLAGYESPERYNRAYIRANGEKGVWIYNNEMLKVISKMTDKELRLAHTQEITDACIQEMYFGNNKCVWLEYTSKYFVYLRAESMMRELMITEAEMHKMANEIKASIKSKMFRETSRTRNNWEKVKYKYRIPNR